MEIPAQSGYHVAHSTCDGKKLTEQWRNYAVIAAGSGRWELTISMDDSEVTTLEQIRTYLERGGEVRFAGQRREEVYGWTERALVRHGYASLNRNEKGLLRRYVARMTGPGL